jgi:hypothetical protein
VEIGAVAEDAYSASVGGVWAIAAVQAEEWKEVAAGIRHQLVKNPRAEVACKNRFEALWEDERNDEHKEHDEENIKNELYKDVAVKAMVKKKGVIKSFGKDLGDKRVHNESRSKDSAAICAVPFASCCGSLACRSPPGLEVCTVSAGARRWRRFGIGEITVDSAAEESVCPKEWCQEFGTRTPSKWLKFVNASGGQMGHYGERLANFKVEGKESGVMSLSFQVSDVQKPLVAVRRIAEKGNIVHFGPGPNDNYIQSMATGVKVMMVRKGGSYVIPAEMLVEEGFQRQAN